MRLTLAAFPFFSFSFAASFSCCCCFSSWLHQLSHFRGDATFVTSFAPAPRDMCHYHIHTQRLQNIAGICELRFWFRLPVCISIAACSSSGLGNAIHAASGNRNCCYELLPGVATQTQKWSVECVWNMCGVCVWNMCGVCELCARWV